MLRLDLVRAALVPVLVIAMVLLDGQDQLVVAAPLLAVVVAPHLAVVVVVVAPRLLEVAVEDQGDPEDLGDPEDPQEEADPRLDRRRYH